MEQFGRYQILGELGRGAMGVVFRALDPTIGREVAIKTIRLSEVQSPEQRARQRERLFREARSAGMLSHPNIVTIYDIAEQDNVAYIAMEFVTGANLEDLLSSREPLPPEKIFSILRQAAVALDYAHRRGIIHRDIKPANLIVDEAGTVKITDFGIAKISTSEHLTQAGLIMGTPNYMSPEQVQGKEVDGFTDQYSLCVVAYEMLTGEKPFVAEQLPTLVYQIVLEEPPPAHRLNATLSPQIDAVLRKGLAKSPTARHLTCTTFVEALEFACRNTPGWKNLARGGSLNQPTVMAETPAPPKQVSPPPPPVLPPPRRRIEPAPGKSRALPATAAVLLIGALAASVYYIGQSTPRPVPPPADAAAPAPTVPDSSPPATPPSDVKSEPEPEAAKPEPEAAKPEPPPEPPPGNAPGMPEPSAPRKKAPPAARVERILSPVEIPVSTAPKGARVLLDGQTAPACVTPCVLSLQPGPHTIALSLGGFQTVSRTIDVGHDPINLPVITLPAAQGIVMLQTQPPGAAVLVNDKPWPQDTPAQLTLAPGVYRLTVEKNGARVTQVVQVRDGDLRHISIPLPHP